MSNIKDLNTTLTIESASDLAIDILTKLISIQSFSREEEKAAMVIEKVLADYGYKVYKKGNNVWAKCKDFQEGRPTIMLNSHLDTVKPVSGWDTDPFEPIIKDGKLFGLGSNDAGGSLVSLFMTFLLSEKLDLDFNRVFVASTEEEISGKQGMEYVVPELGKIDVGAIESFDSNVLSSPKQLKIVE